MRKANLSRSQPLSQSMGLGNKRIANKRKRLMQRRLNMSDAQREAIAKRAYNNVWNAVAPAFGAEGMPAPEVEFMDGPTVTGNGAVGTTVPRQGKPKVIQLSKGTIKALSLLPGAAKRGAKSTLVHEFAHVYQNPEIWEDKGLDPEILANMFTEYQLKKRLGINPLEKNWINYKPFQDIIRRRGRGIWRKGQFSSNYGKNPQEIY